ncbi:uncharacterized protein N7503_003143 [Penicillium pulvis]|uniref:uncharacterized protein n=1 Tax=Penicillium pulvis TaxID=1562058 RepID=UPI002548CA72|nr:uncharacterized protein N7503_003143 [Penicillium pulvis]KAJ5805541.1 hypothetical protein N7503_003143 [Penicillium pulvis]
MQPRELSQDYQPLALQKYTQANRRQHRLTFVNDNKQDIRKLNSNNAAKHRRAIFTESERHYMSNEVINSLPGRDHTQALLDIERFECMTNESVHFSFFRGPFGVSRLAQTPISEETVPSDEDIPLLSDDWILGLDQITSQEELDFELIDSILENPEKEQTNSLHPWSLITSNAEDVELGLSTTPQIETPLTFFSNNIEAWSILSHYKDKIVPLVSPLGFGQEAPWLNLIMPCAISALSDLSANRSVPYAQLALLNALLSTSAFHMGNHSTRSTENWVATGKTYMKRSQQYFLRCMEELCLSTEKTSKYKDILMVLLSLSTAYMIQGDAEQRLSCLIQAEKFISINGFKASTLSPKRRALHHCYAFMRIMAETTSINDNLSATLMGTNLSDETMPYSDFRIYPNIVFSENIMAMEKDPAVAQRDLHLAIPGRWSLTLFPKIYGIAESFLMLLSQVIRLANERDISLHQSEEGVLNLRDFWMRAKALEKAIRVLLISCDGHTNWEDESQVEGKPRARAMYTALLIFFHRRINDLDPSLLQREVEAVRDFLERVRVDEAGLGGENMATLIWPAFIAACEAVHSETQIFFSYWFESCFAMTGLNSASVAKQIIEMIWAKREESGLDGEMCNWPDILRAKKIRLMCT